MTEIIKTDGTRQPVQPANGSDFTLGGVWSLVRIQSPRLMKNP